MAPIKAEITGEHPGLGQMIADKIMRETTLLMEDNIVFRQDPQLLTMRSELYIHSRRSGIDVEEIKSFYEDKLLPQILRIHSEIESGRMVELSEKRRFYKPLVPKTFKEIQDILMKEIEDYVPEDAEDSAVDGIIMGEIKTEDLFLPYQKQIKERVLAVLDNRYDIDEDVRDEIEAAGKSIILETHGESIFEILPFDNNGIQRLIEEGEMDEALGNAILAARSDIEELFGESELDQEGRIKAIKSANLGVIDIKEDQGEKGGVTMRDIELLGLMADKTRELPEMGLTDGKDAVVRMRHGIGVEDDHSIDAHSGINEDTARRLREMENEMLRVTRGPAPKDPKSKPPKNGLRIVKDDE